jgi:hypothetical protein
MRALAMLVSLAVFAEALPAFAQEEPEVFTGDEPVEGENVFTGDEELPQESPEEPPPATDPSGWALPRILVVPERRTPDALIRNLYSLLGTVGEVVPADDYIREARSRGFPPEADEAFEAVLPEMDVELVVVVGVRAGRRSRRAPRPRRVHFMYREGQDGLALLEEEHDLPSDTLVQLTADRVLAEARLALAVITRPRAPGVVQEGDEVRPVEARLERRGPRREPGAAVQVALSAGGGFGMRQFELPTELGVVRLTTDPFPIADLALLFELEPTARGQLELFGALHYTTSLGLRTDDMRPDGTVRNTASRSQALEIAVGARYRVVESIDSVALGGLAGFGVRLFSSEAPVTIPDYGLSAVTIRGLVIFPFLEGRLELELAPELQFIFLVDDALTSRGVDPFAVALGGVARFAAQLTGPLYAGAIYRESHAFLTTDDEGAGDVERYVSAYLEYRP